MNVGKIAEQSGASARTPSRSSRAALVAAVGFGGLAAFQLALAAGTPLGRAAWGGGQTYLPTGLRVASAANVLFYALAILLVLRRGGFRARQMLGRIPAGFARIGVPVLAGLLTLSALANAMSQSLWERFVMAPTALSLAALCLAVSRGPVFEQR